MSKTLISAILAVFLTLVVLSPSFILIADGKVEIEYFENSEEEKESRGEHKVEIETLLSISLHKIVSSDVILSKCNSGYFFKWYPIPHLNLISPPPERV